jgi:hypothetical protein
MRSRWKPFATWATAIEADRVRRRRAATDMVDGMVDWPRET